MSDADVIIIGSGMGGATLAAQLAPTGRRILIVEKGERLKPSSADRDADAIFGKAHFRPKEEWLDGDGQPFNPGNYYNVGGNSKFYGAVLLRYRREDFSPLHHMGGTTPGWPIAYDSLEPWYQQAEHLFEVRGTLGEDPTEPPHSGTYQHKLVPDEPTIADLRRRLKSVGLHPASLPLGIDIDTWLAHGKTTWDAFPDTCGGKKDAETVSLAHALRHPNVSLVTGCEVTRLLTGEGGKVTGVEVLNHGKPKMLSAPLVVLSAGAVRSAAILLSSADERHPQGLANRSDQVGRNFMNHNCSAVLALHPFRRNPSVYQKTLLVNDFYLTGGPNGEPLGNIQLLGKITGPILSASSPLPRPLAHWIADRSIDLYAMSEDLPNPESRVTVGTAGSCSTGNGRTGRRISPRRQIEITDPKSRLPGRALAPVRSAHALPPMRHGAHGFGPDDECGRQFRAQPRSSQSLHRRCVDPADLGRRQPGPDDRSTRPAVGPAHHRNGVQPVSKVALITGGQQGIGLGIARELAGAGYKLALASRSDEDAPQVKAALAELGEASIYVRHDLQVIDNVASVLDQVEARLGPVTTFVSNAGVPAKVRGDMLALTPDSFDFVLGVNLRGAFFLAQEVARRMLATPSDSYRSIVFVTSVSARMASIERAEYCISKAGAGMMAELFALRLAPHGIGVLN